LIEHVSNHDLADLANRINQHHKAAEAAISSGLEHALQTDRSSLEGKEQIAHGACLPWPPCDIHRRAVTTQANRGR
jgi:hypothetical protein